MKCSALLDHPLEAELFGHVKGAFTGALSTRVGRFEQAHRGTLFLDEIGDMPLGLQAKLLRVLQEREFQRLANSESVKVDVRVAAATSADLVDKVKKRSARTSITGRTSFLFSCHLCANGSLIFHCWSTIFWAGSARMRESQKHASQGLGRLCQHHWPGNVREVKNSVEMAVALSGEGRLLCPSDFPIQPGTKPFKPPLPAFVTVPDYGLGFERIVGTFELYILEQAQRKTGGNKKLAADMLRLKRTTLAATLKTLSEFAVPVPAQ